MAKNDKKQAAVEPTSGADIDLSKFLPEGFSLDDFQSVGGLRPICPPEVNAETPIVGWIVALLDMPARKADGTSWQGLLINLMTTAQAQTSDGEIVTVEAGKDVIIPVGGNLKVNQDLLAAAVDPRKVTAGIFTVTGQLDVGKPSKMWVYEVRLALKKQKAREGAFALYHKPAEPLATYHQGQVIGKDGQAVGSLVGKTAQA